MKTHVQIVAVLHIAMGILGLLVAIGIFLIVGMAGGIVAANGEHGVGGILGIVAIVVGGILAVLAIPSIVAGWALTNGKSWGRLLAMVVGALHIANVPFGTALGVYTFWALLYEPPAPGDPSMRPLA